MRRKEIKTKKNLFIEVFKKTFGNIAHTCNTIGIDRKTYYNWYKNDLEFKEKIDDIEIDEVLLDAVESKAHERIMGIKVATADGQTAYKVPPSDTMIIFILKTKGKKRGYIESVENIHSGKIIVKRPKAELDEITE